MLDIFLAFYYILMVFAYAAPVLFASFCFWRGVNAANYTVKAVWGIAAFLPVFIFFWYNGTAERLQTERDEQFVADDRVFIKGRSFDKMVVFGWVGSDAQLMMWRLFGIKTFYVIESNVGPTPTPLDQSVSLNVREFSIIQNLRCRAYADYMVNKLIASNKPPHLPPPGKPVVVDFDYPQKQREELARVYVDWQECILERQRKFDAQNLPRGAIYYSNGAVPSLMNNRIWKGAKSAIQVYADGKLRLVDYYEVPDTERQSSPFCLPISNFCKSQADPKVKYPDVLAMIHHALTGQNLYD
jgi:hypothetical protein